MRFTKSIMAACVALFFAACSSDNLNVNELPETPEATQALTFSLQLANTQPASRLAGNPTEDHTEAKQVLAINKVDINLTAEGFPQSGKWITIIDKNPDSSSLYNTNITVDTEGKKVTVFGINEPSKLQVRINHTDDKAPSSIKDFQVQKAQDMPAYGATTKFNKYAGIAEHGSKKYDKITAEVTVEIPVARIELSNFEVKTSSFSAVNLQQIFINNILTDLTVSDTETKFSYSGRLEKITYNTINQATLRDEIKQSVLNKLPQSYVYSVFPSKELPRITFVFDNIKVGNNLLADNRYAVITGFNQSKDFKFEAGKIYRIKEVAIPQEAIGADINGNSQQALEVEITVKDWTIEDISDLSWN